MPRKASSETYIWGNAKEKRFLEKMDEFLSYSGGASGFGSVTMRDGSTPYVDPEFSIDNFGTHLVLEDEITPTNGGRQANTRRAGDDVGPSRSKGSSGKRKQRETTNEMTYSAM
ncbi:hypothetical protein TIFTF001_027761 [Ficus carica]|uniref:Uncharacterized protein n=1 Tax=Ficus carica TaxID=3494 RepID=A0AA88DNJ5_FICCA|nr:hypothetical protein TIFTF001_027761 [Ficus carica]